MAISIAIPRGRCKCALHPSEWIPLTDDSSGRQTVFLSLSLSFRSIFVVYSVYTVHLWLYCKLITVSSLIYIRLISDAPFWADSLEDSLEKRFTRAGHVIKRVP